MASGRAGVLDGSGFLGERQSSCFGKAAEKEEGGNSGCFSCKGKKGKVK